MRKLCPKKEATWKETCITTYTQRINISWRKVDGCCAGQNLPKQEKNCRFESDDCPQLKRKRTKVILTGDSLVTTNKKASMRCAKCVWTNLSHPHLKFMCMPQFQSELGNNPSLVTVINRQRKTLLHEEKNDCIAL